MPFVIPSTRERERGFFLLNDSVSTHVIPRPNDGWKGDSSNGEEKLIKDGLPVGADRILDKPPRGDGSKRDQGQ